MAEIEQLAASLSWALDLLDMYDKRLVELGEPHQMVYSDIHVRGKEQARGVLARASSRNQVQGD